MKNTYKRIFDGINPSDELLNSVFEMREKKKKRIAPKVIASVLVLAVLVTGGAMNFNSIRNALDPNSFKTVPIASFEPQQESNQGFGFVMVANAAEINSDYHYDVDYTKQHADLQTLYDDSVVVSYVSTKDMTEEQISAVKKALDSKLCYSADSNVSITETDNGLFGYSWADYFKFVIPNPNQIKEIRISNVSEYGMMRICSDDYLYDEYNVRHDEYQYEKGNNILYEMVGNVLSFPGERYLKNAILEKSTRYFYNEEEKCYHAYNSSYRGMVINWIPSQKLMDEFDKNSNFDISSVFDKITFEVEFKNGDVAKSVAEINFNKKGMMNEKLVKFDYIEN